MNEETNEFLKENLIEAHFYFKYLINEMKNNNIPFEYEIIESMEQNSFNEINNRINKMAYFVLVSENLKEDNKELFHRQYSLYLKYISLYIVSMVLIRLYYEIFDMSKLNEMLKYMVGMFLGSTYIGLLNKDLYDNQNDTKEKRDTINRLKTMREEYKKNHDEVVHEIDNIFSINSSLWNILDDKKIIKKFE